MISDNNFLHEFIRLEVMSILNEVTLDQVFSRLHSKPFQNQLAELGLDLDPDEAQQNILKLIPNDISDNMKGSVANWLITSFVRGNSFIIAMPISDSSAESFQATIEKYFSYQQAMSEKDIMRIANIKQMREIINEAEEKIQIIKKKELANVKNWKTGTKEVFQNSDWTIIIPETKGASCYWGADTDWCTARKSQGHYEEYHRNGNPLYIIINNHDLSERYQFHFGSQQFKNKDDHTMSDLEKLVSILEILIPVAGDVSRENLNKGLSFIEGLIRNEKDPEKKVRLMKRFNSITSQI